jgi:hypothetical protein
VAFTIASWRMTPPIGAATICSAAEIGRSRSVAMRHSSP